MAFQPIIDCHTQSIFGYEALVRGLNNEPAYSVIAKVNVDNRYVFDQECRIKAISLAAKLGINSMRSINFLPNAIYQPERCIRTTLEAAKQFDFPTENIMFEFTEVEKIEDSSHVERIIKYYQSLGFQTAIDEYMWLRDIGGVTLMQGYLFAKPGFESLPSVNFLSLQPT